LPGCDVIVLHPPLTGPSPSPALNRWLDAISVERELVNPALRLAIENRAENHDGVSPQLLDDFERMRAIAGEWDLHLTLDLAHAASTGHDLLQAIDMLAPRLVNVHLSDAVARQYRGGLRNGLLRDHQVPGSGLLPVEAVLDKLVDVGYKGLVTIELSPVSLHAWWPTTAKRLLAHSVAVVHSAIATGTDATRPRMKPRSQAR
jgi:sugar phosphate isomerase/epimerase